MPTQIELSPAGHHYTIHVGEGLLREVGPICHQLGLGRRALVVTNETLTGRFGSAVRESLAASGFVSEIVAVPDGESEKSWARAGWLLDACVDAGLDRGSFVVALGGGVVGDLAGFVASVYMRGIPFVQVPTTLLAQVDASVGGKVAVNHPRGKNLLGSFHQPAAVIADIATLRTLPQRELRAGLAEVVKHGLIRDPHLYAYVAENPARFAEHDARALERVVVESCRIKADVVQRDEREHGERAILNFGHTVGHAVEAAAGYGQLIHGEAVAVGMVAETILSLRLGGVQKSDVAALIALLRALGLPTRPPAGVATRALDYLSQDKKVRDGKLRFALLARVGEAEVVDGPGPDEVAAVLAAMEAGEYGNEG